MLHGDDDQVVPIADSAELTIKLLKHGTLKVYPGYPHGAFTIHADVINPDILAFLHPELLPLPPSTLRRRSRDRSRIESCSVAIDRPGPGDPDYNYFRWTAANIHPYGRSASNFTASPRRRWSRT